MRHMLRACKQIACPQQSEWARRRLYLVIWYRTGKGGRLFVSPDSMRPLLALRSEQRPQGQSIKSHCQLEDSAQFDLPVEQSRPLECPSILKVALRCFLASRLTNCDERASKTTVETVEGKPNSHRRSLVTSFVRQSSSSRLQSLISSARFLSSFKRRIELESAATHPIATARPKRDSHACLLTL